jgi:hypothetical protein
MECQTALENLDCVRPDSDDLDLPEMAAARAHLESCDACQEAFAEMQDFDRAVAGVVQHVDVPAHLRSALLDATAKEIACVPDPVAAETLTDEVVSPAIGSRRRALRVAVSAACALMLGVGAWLSQSQPMQFTEAELLQRLPLDLSSTKEFDTGFEFSLPATWVGNGRLRVGREFRGIDLDDAAGHDAAVTIFSYSASRNASIDGILAAIPASRVQPLPNSVSFAQADSRYILKDGRRPVVAVWQERDTVYVCLILGSAADLEQIQRNLSTSAA